MALPDWLSRYFQQPTIRDANDDDMPSRSNIQFLNATVTDDANNDQTVVDLSTTSINSTVHPLTYAGQGPTYTVAETAGEVSLPVRALTSALVIKAPTTPTVGMKIKIKIVDMVNFSDVNTVTFNGNGNSVEMFGTIAATAVLTPENVGIKSPCLVWEWDGTDWLLE
jgi:hypothetical protein